MKNKAYIAPLTAEYQIETIGVILSESPNEPFTPEPPHINPAPVRNNIPGNRD